MDQTLCKMYKIFANEEIIKKESKVYIENLLHPKKQVRATHNLCPILMICNGSVLKKMILLPAVSRSFVSLCILSLKFKKFRVV